MPPRTSGWPKSGRPGAPRRSRMIVPLSATNLLLGRQEADDELQAVLTMLLGDRTLDIIPEGLETPIESRGRGLTGAAASVVSIARAVVRKPQVLVLDRAVERLDVPVPARLLQAQHDTPDGASVVIVTSRRSIAEQADRILDIPAG